MAKSACSLLSGKELFEQLDKVHVENLLPEKGGQKDYAPDGSWLQAKRLEKYQQGLLQVLRLQHVEVQHKLCLGEWEPQSQKIHLHRVTGNIFHYMGHIENGKKMLFPEEALILMDMGVLEVQYGGVTLSIQEAYSCMLSRTVPLHHYQVYATLSRMGYIVMRHRGVSTVTNYERKIRLDQHLSQKELFRKATKVAATKLSEERKRSLNVVANSAEDAASKQAEEGTSYKIGKFENDYQIESSTSAEYQLAVDVETANGGTTGNSRLSNLKLLNWDFKEIQFPNLADASSLTMEKPDETLLPDRQDIDIAAFRRTKYSPINIKFSFESRHDLEFSHSSSYGTGKLLARNWREFKNAQCDRRFVNLQETPCGHLWSDRIKPLVEPCDAKSTGSILSRLQIIPEVSLNQENLLSSDVQPSVIYDVYKPDSQFKKTQPGLPDHRICIREQQDSIPLLPELLNLNNSYKDGVPIHWAVVDNGDVAFYAFHDFSAPIQICMG